MKPQRRPADVGRSVSIIVGWTALGVVASPIALAMIGGMKGLYAAIAVAVAGAAVAFHRSDAVSDSDRWKADDARRRGVRGR